MVYRVLITLKDGPMHRTIEIQFKKEDKALWLADLIESSEEFVSVSVVEHTEDRVIYRKG